MIAGLAAAGAVAAEALAAYVLAEWLAAGYAPGDHAVSGLTFVVCALVAFGLPRLVQGLAGSGRRAYGSAVASVMLLWYAALRIEFAGDLALWDLGWLTGLLTDAQRASEGNGDVAVGAVLLFAVCARSLFRAAAEVDMELIPKQVGLPFAVVTLSVVFAAATDNSGAVARAGAAFYAVTVLALALSQLALSGATIGGLRAGSVTGMLLGGTVVATVICVLIFGLVFGVLGPVLGPVIEATIETVLMVVLTPPAWLLEKLFSLIFQGAAPLQELAGETVTQNAQRAGEGPERGQAPWVKATAMLMRLLALAIILGVGTGILLLAMALRRKSRSAAEASPSMGSSGSLRDDAAAFVRRLFSRQPSRAYDPTTSEAVRLYREVLDGAASRGYPRNPAETAGEFAPKLHDAFHAQVTDDITLAFQEARYAGREPSPASVAELRQRWRASTSGPL